MRSLSSATRFGLSARQRESLKDHVTRLIYWGAVATDRIIDILPFAATWMVAFSNMAGVNPTKGRKINGRVYRDFESLRAYQMLSVRAAREELLATTNGEP
jgi:hypothetical protein